VPYKKSRREINKKGRKSRGGDTSGGIGKGTVQPGLEFESTYRKIRNITNNRKRGAQKENRLCGEGI